MEVDDFELRRILRRLWRNLPRGDFDLQLYRDFAKNILGPHHTHQTRLSDILEFVGILRKYPQRSKSNLYDNSSRRRGVIPFETLEQKIDIAASIWLPLVISGAQSWCPDATLQWDAHESLTTVVEAHFASKRRTALRGLRDKLPPNFTLSNLCRKYDLGYSWTNSLADHLTLDHAKRIVRVYKYPICLYHHCHPDEQCPIPRLVLEEALDTIALLLPSNDGETTEFLGPELASSFLWVFRAHPRSRNLDLNHYQYWADNLSQLINEIDRSWEQKVTWANQWFTWVVGIFAVVSTALSIVSIVVAYKANTISTKSLDLAAAQLEISVAELCREDDIARKLPRHCELLETESPRYFRSSLMDENKEP